MQEFKEYLINHSVIDQYAVYVYEDLETIPNYEELSKMGRLPKVEIVTYGENDGNEKTVHLLKRWRTGQFFITMDEFNRYWKRMKSGLEDADTHVKIKLLRKNGRGVKFENDKIAFYSSGSAGEWKKYVRKRASLMDNRNILYIYSADAYTVHDKSCALVKKIEDRYFCGSEEMPPRYNVCSQCERALYLRRLSRPDDARLDRYLKFMDRLEVATDRLQKLSSVDNARIYLEYPRTLSVKCKEDTWKIVVGEDWSFQQLLHNDYVMTGDTSRYIVSDYHVQNGSFTNLNDVMDHILSYSFEQHLIVKEGVGVFSKQERWELYHAFRETEIEYYLKPGLVKELRNEDPQKRSTAQERLLQKAGMDISNEKYFDLKGEVSFSDMILDVVRTLMLRKINGDVYVPQYMSRRILVDLGIQESVKPLISEDIKTLSAYLCYDNETGRHGYTPDIVEAVFEGMKKHTDFHVISLEDLRLLVRMGRKGNDGYYGAEQAMKIGIDIILSPEYQKVKWKGFVKALMSNKGSAICHKDLLRYLDGDEMTRRKYDDAYSMHHHKG